MNNPGTGRRELARRPRLHPYPAGASRRIGLSLPVVIGYLLREGRRHLELTGEGDDDLAEEDAAAPLPAPAGAVPGGDDSSGPPPLVSPPQPCRP